MPPIKPSVYALGTTAPYFKKDPGAGVWNSQTANLDMKVLKEILTTGGVQWLASHLGGDDAVKHIDYYFSNVGGKYTIDFAGLIRETSTGKKTQSIQLDAAKKFVEKLPVGRHSFTSTSGSLNHNINQGENKNWFFAVASYTSWGRGTAVVKSLGGKRRYQMDFEYNFLDNYNWDKGKKVNIPIPGYSKLPQMLKDQIEKIPNVTGGRLKITDKFMGDFHRMGLAKEFQMIGKVKLYESWSPSSASFDYTVKAGDTLSGLAKTYLGDLKLWPKIHQLNRAAVPNPDRIRVGQKLKIPA